MNYLTRLFSIVLFASALFQTAARGGESRLGEVSLPTELKVSGPAVFIRGPLGLRYRPGCSFPIEVRVHNSGPEFSAELTLSEGAADNPARSGIFDAVSFPSQASRVFSFPIRAPAVSANLILQIREMDSSGGTGALRFQGSLARVLKPLAPETPLILSVSASRASGPVMLPNAIQIKAQELPDQSWQYENIDVVVLSDASLKDVSTQAKETLRLWLLGGGRLFVASNEALAPAIAANLFPIEQAAAAEKIGADLAWWEKHAGLGRANVLIEKNNRPVYAFLNLGFGSVVFLFPGTHRGDADTEGAKLINHPILQSQRERFPDLRVQPDRYAAFAAGSLSKEQRNQLQLWLGIGAMVFCIGLALGFTSRMRLLSVGWPLTIAVLLSVMLAKWFPSRDLSVLRIDWRRTPLDGRSTQRTEWALLQAVHTPVALTVSGPENGTLLPLYAYSDEINQAQFNFMMSGSRLVMQDSVVLPRQTALFAASAVSAVSASPGAARKFLAKEGKLVIESAQAAGEDHAVLARANGTLWVLSGLKSPGGFEIRKFDDWVSILRSTSKNGEDSKLKAQATALAWATRDALRSKRDTLIVWKQADAGSPASLIGFDFAGNLASETFSMQSLQVAVAE